ncbi:toll/interleukin-1 receptor domain-containing protein [candidate division KSB1 bacterium]|nr:toll/interleukin-1 receptor domain-containing protein [candidate division KSB1 bacterium]
MLPKEIFLSHSDKDREFAVQLVRVLRNHGLPVWYSRSNIRGAQQWHDEIGAALNRCDWFLIILSPNAVQSLWVKRELIFALQHQRFENKIVPVLYRSCDYDNLSWTLSQFQIIDFTQPLNTACQELLRTWGLGYQPELS